jgi:A/G-specific adenine glycosylase
VTVALNQMAVREFQQKVMDWWSCNARDLPWRREPTPYKVLVSEVMLQQTQVNRVISKYLQFLQEFPTLESLAAAKTKHLLTIWSGLGYNRRALWLREAAKQIVERGNFPREYAELLKLKGIGPYTSRSILIFAFNQDLAAVDTNIRRVIIASGFATESMTDNELQEVANALLLRGRSRDWHNALMDYGSYVLTSSSTGILPTSRQPRFKGSTRELRGAIVRALAEGEHMSLSQLVIRIGLECEKEALKGVLNQLVAEGLISQAQSQKYRIAD